MCLTPVGSFHTEARRSCDATPRSSTPISGSPPMHSPVLQLESVSAYYGGLCAVRDENLTIDQGECLSLIGPNGAGTTTLLKAISGVLESPRGKVSYLGRDATRMTPRQRIAAVLI